MSTDGELNTCSFAAKPLRRSTSLIINTAMTGNTRPLSRTVTHIADGWIASQGVGDAVDVQIFACYVQLLIDNVRMTISTLKSKGSYV
jgi:hypothetical protein